MVESYRTVARVAEAEIEAKRSRFLARIEPVSSEGDARAVIEAARARHWDARHHCSAFVLGPDGQTARSSDDGEPAGTAGVPMLEVLRGRGLTDVVAVVTRWFGGTLLGTGGLVKAYSQATSEGLDVAGVLGRQLMGEYALRLDHAHAGRVETELRSRGYAVLDVRHEASVTLTLGVPRADLDAATELVARLTGGDGSLVATGERWVDAPDAG